MTSEPGIVIVGGGPAGFSAAGAYRAAGGELDVSLVSAEEHLPYQRPPLTKELLRGEAGVDELPLETQTWFAENRVAVLPDARAMALDTERQVVRVEGHEELTYSACVLATGSEPARLPVPGGDDPGLHTVRTVEDSLALARTAGHETVVVGSGFIGCEAAASLAMLGSAVTLVSDEPAPQSTRLGNEVGERLAAWLQEAGVRMLTGEGVESFERRGEGWAVSTASAVAEARTVLIAAGVSPRLDLAEEAGLSLAGGAVAADASMRSSSPEVFVAGDIAYAENAAAGRPLRVEHWGEALRQGEVAGTMAAGHQDAWRQAPGFWSQIGDRTLKYVAWGDGYHSVSLEEHGGGAFTAWYLDEEGVLVGVLTHQRDEDYERGRELVEGAATRS
jgi:NADPH-dependent 2,4-dienoyl-CoA reductase/sulfur reductase-like enzyme